MGTADVVASLSGVHVDPLSAGGFTSAVSGLLAGGGSHVIHFLAAHAMSLAREDPHYRMVLNGGSLNLADGVAVVTALRLRGVRGSRLAGSDGMHALCQWGLGRGIRHYLYGWDVGALSRLRDRLEAAHTGIEIVGVHSPASQSLTLKEVAADATGIARAKADVVWVGLGTPRQDFVAEELRRSSVAPVIACVGAAFDFLSGDKRRAPGWMRRLGLEWLHRLVSEPRRLWRRYLVESPAFMLGALREEASRRWRAARPD